MQQSCFEIFPFKPQHNSYTNIAPDRHSVANQIKSNQVKSNSFNIILNAQTTNVMEVPRFLIPINSRSIASSVVNENISVVTSRNGVSNSVVLLPPEGSTDLCIQDAYMKVDNCVRISIYSFTFVRYLVGDMISIGSIQEF